MNLRPGAGREQAVHRGPDPVRRGERHAQQSREQQGAGRQTAQPPVHEAQRLAHEFTHIRFHIMYGIINHAIHCSFIN